jgi:hypothetical protein
MHGEQMAHQREQAVKQQMTQGRHGTDSPTQPCNLVSLQRTDHFTIERHLVKPVSCISSSNNSVIMQSLLVVVLLSLASFASGFSVAPMTKAHKSTTMRKAALGINLDDENSYRYLMARAKECAYSDYTTSSEARRYLQEILHIEEGCMSGSLSGHDLCDNVDEMADIVAHLRIKVQEDAIDMR